MDERLAEQVHRQIINALQDAHREIVRKAVMETDKPLTDSNISPERLNEASAYFENFVEEFQQTDEHWFR